MFNEVDVWKWVEFGSPVLPQLPLAALFFSTSNNNFLKKKDKVNLMTDVPSSNRIFSYSTHLHFKLLH